MEKRKVKQEPVIGFGPDIFSIITHFNKISPLVEM